jgi:diguanylate cyclase (GGDEF)-like protein
MSRAKAPSTALRDPRWLSSYGVFAAAFLLLAANGVVFFWSFDRLVTATVWVRHTQEVRQLMTGILSALVDAESGQRGYLLTHDPAYLDPFRSGYVIAGQKIDDLLKDVADNPPQVEAATRLAKLSHDELDALATAIAERNAGKTETDFAQSMRQSRETMDTIRATFQRMDQQESGLLATRLKQYDTARIAAVINQSVFLALGLIMLAANFILMRRDIRRRDEAAAEDARYTRELDQNVKALAVERNEIARLNDVSTFLQSCGSIEEFATLAGPLLAGLFPGRSGAIYVYAASRNQLTCRSTWGETSGDPEVIDPAQCWALRRSALHHFTLNGASPVCGHLHHFAPVADAQCIPLVAYGETMGLLTLRTNEPAAGTDNQRLVTMAARQLALTLANLNLRQSLRDQSIRDPLTGAFNGRYLEVVGEKELVQSSRSERDCAVVMLDVDHFKRFNDLHGHAAGDFALVAVSDYLQKNIRSSDWLFRYGGEEFVVLLRETTRTEAEERVRLICYGIAEMPLAQDGKVLPRVTVSMGVAVFPEHGDTLQVLLQRADEALYASKAAGRNRFSFAFAA